MKDPAKIGTVPTGNALLAEAGAAAWASGS